MKIFTERSVLVFSRPPSTVEILYLGNQPPTPRIPLPAFTFVAFSTPSIQQVTIDFTVRIVQLVIGKMADILKGLFGGAQPAQTPLAAQDDAGSYSYIRTRLLDQLLTKVMHRLRRLCWSSRPISSIHPILRLLAQRSLVTAHRAPIGTVHQMVSSVGAHDHLRLLQ
jgi:hypothetical protein